jgi:hypothetical protein
MPDLLTLVKALTAAAMTAAAVLLLGGWPWRAPRPARASAGAVLGAATGLLAGCWMLGLMPQWPPREDRDRLLLVLVPALVGVELLAALSGRLRWLAWLGRVVVALGAGRVLLHGTSYLADLAGPGTREWTPGQAGVILGGLAVALAGVWAALAALARRTPGRSVPLALALTCAGAGGTVLLSGYAGGGQLGLVLAAALLGAVAASLALGDVSAVRGVVGLGVVGLFALLVLGRFFGQLATGHAVLLFGAPLLCWLPELPHLRRVGPRLRALARVALVLVPVVVALTLARQDFLRDSVRTSTGASEPSLQDYLDYGK